jgi:hypothetical protein
MTVKVAALGVPSKKAVAARSVSPSSCAQPIRPLNRTGAASLTGRKYAISAPSTP